MKRLKTKYIKHITIAWHLGVYLSSLAHGIQVWEHHFWHYSFQNFATFKLWNVSFLGHTARASKKEVRLQFQLKISLYRNLNVSIFKHYININNLSMFYRSKTVAHHHNQIQWKSSLTGDICKALMLFKIKTKDQSINLYISEY